MVVALGLSLDVEREGMDRTDIGLPGEQQALLTAVLAAAKPAAPVVLLLLSGGCVDVSAAQDDPRVSAIIWAGYPGQAGGEAVADALYGDCSPAGRLTQTWYPDAYIDQVRPQMFFLLLFFSFLFHKLKMAGGLRCAELCWSACLAHRPAFP